ncbi:MAG: S8 family serine peptidase, partial [Bdellovibrionales bacterium]|nr:S8 family serine peptidase [Bdellovibrionales bacterium]
MSKTLKAWNVKSNVRALVALHPNHSVSSGESRTWIFGMCACLSLVVSLIASQGNAGEALILRTGEVDIADPTQTRGGRHDIYGLRGVTPAMFSPQFQPVTVQLEEGEARSRRPDWISTRGRRAGNKKADARKVRHFVVQMHSRISSEDLINFKSLKIRPLRYLPEDAVVVADTARKLQVLAKSSNRIRAIALYQPEWKRSPEIGASSIFSGDPVVTSMVRLFPGQDAKTVLPHLKKMKVKVLSASGRGLVVESKRSLLADVAAIDAVEWIEPNAELSLPWFNDENLRLRFMSGTGDYTDLTGYESGTRLMGFDSVWARGFSGQGEVVGFADTGLDTGDAQTIHADFAGRVVKGYAEGLFSKSWEDPMGHGTHVAGSAIGDGAASAGLLKGGAPLAGTVAQSLWSPMMDNIFPPSNLRDMFGKAYAAGARIHTNSWGAAAGLGVYNAMAQQVDEFIYSNPDFLVLFAAGNSGEDADRDGRIDGGSILSPATAKNVLTVGASKNLVANGGIQAKLIELRAGTDKWGAEPLASSRLSENERGLAAFSSRGPTVDGRLKPEVVAPGTNILSARTRHVNGNALWGAYNESYVWSGGTSMSTPLVAGAAAVVRGYLVKERGLVEPSAALLKAVIMHTSEDLFPGQFGAVGASRGQELLTTRPNMDQGYGRVDVAKATELESALLVDEKTGLGPGEKHVYPVTLSKSTMLSATLVYTDAPGAPTAAQALVNDLDLTIIDSSGKRHTLGDRV